MTNHLPAFSGGRPALLFMGGLGALLCLALVAGTWIVQAKLNRAGRRLATAVDRSLSLVDEKLGSARSVVDDARLTVGDVETLLASWTRDEVGERITGRLELGKRLDQSTTGIDQARHLLDEMQTLIDAVEQLLNVAKGLGMPVSGEAASELGTKVMELAAGVGQLATLTAECHDLLAGAGSNSGPEPDERGRIAQAAKVTGRLLATFGAVDEGLAECAIRVDSTRQAVERLAAQTGRRLFLLAIAATLLLAWMAAGQVSLLRRGWGS